MKAKTVAVKSAKKVVAPKPAKVVKPVKGESKTFTKGGVVFEVTAVIPTQQYGNIQPRIQIVCDTIEEGRAMVMPVIEDLYKTYAEMPLNGRELKFLGKIVETVKTVAPANQVAPTASPKVAVAPVTEEDVAYALETPTAPAKVKSEAVLKAEKAIGLAMSNDALIAIGDQIEKSVKIAPEDKPDLQVMVLKRRNEFK